MLKGRQSDGICVYFDFVVLDVDLEGLNASERLRLAKKMVIASYELEGF